jgi:SAM-dependent methyltransferase
MTHTCRLCRSTKLNLILDLGTAPPSNSFLTVDQLDEPETYYPLRLFFCEDCGLVQLPEYKQAAEIFKDDYPYYSSQSPSNVSHAKEYVEMITKRFNPESVMEIGSNDGYLLQHFSPDVHIFGFEPSIGLAEEAIKKGIPTSKRFFNSKRASCESGIYDLICGINVLAHQPDINDFVEGLKIALAPGGVVTMEFPHLMHLIDECQFDTVYQEHYCYFSFFTIRRIFAAHDLEMFDVEELPEHGGSLRIYAHHKKRPLREPMDHGRPSDARVFELLRKEFMADMNRLRYYQDFQTRADTIKNDLVLWLHQQKYQRENVIGYGAPAKANTLLNYCGVRADLIDFVVDRSPHKIGKFLPGSRIPVVGEDEIRELKPAYILVLPWNLREEIGDQLSYARDWGCKLVVAIPELKIW